jgi:hypothetical protein
MLLEALHELGIPSWLDQSHLANHLAGYDVKPRQMKINDLNRNGYDWDAFMKPFRMYVTKKETEEVEQEIGVRKVEGVRGRRPPEAS